MARVARDRECHCSLNRVANLACSETDPRCFVQLTLLVLHLKTVLYFQIALLALVSLTASAGRHFKGRVEVTPPRARTS